MGFVNCELKDKIAVITINRPEALNALNSQVLEDLDAAFSALDLNVVRAVVLTGAGEKSFVAGADIGEMSTLSKADLATSINFDSLFNISLIESVIINQSLFVKRIFL